jgi:hypothetical protein
MTSVGGGCLWLRDRAIGSSSFDVVLLVVIGGGAGGT